MRRAPQRTAARRDTRLARRLSLSIMATAVLASLTLAVSPAHAADCAGANLLPALSSVPTAKAATLCLLNDERATRGLAPLSTQAELETAAQNFSQAMVQHRFFAHVSPGGQTITDRLAGYTGAALSYATGENLAWGEGALATPTATVRGWMASAGHRDNILNGRFTDVGVGIAGGTPSGGLPALSATYTTAFGSRTLATTSGSSIETGSGVPTTSTKRLSARKKAQISQRCHRVAKRTKASKKVRKARYNRCVRKETRAATR